jgi:hypothetical protein
MNVASLDTGTSIKVKIAPQVMSEQAIEGFVTIQEATRISGDSATHLRRLLRAGILVGFRSGKLWLVAPDSLSAYLYTAISENDLRYGPHKAWKPPF